MPTGAVSLRGCCLSHSTPIVQQARLYWEHLAPRGLHWIHVQQQICTTFDATSSTCACVRLEAHRLWAP